MPVNSFLVLGVVPANNEQQVPVNTAITISFAKHMDVNTLTDANIKLCKVNGEYIPYVLSYSHDTYKLVLKPSVLDGNTQYQVEIVGGTTGIRSVTGDYTSTRTYEFTTVLTKAISQPQNLVVTQKDAHISAKWKAPAVVNSLEAVVYHVRVSASSDPKSPYLWPSFPVGTEYTQEGTNLSIEDDFERERNYYVMVRATSSSATSDWTIAQIYLEPKAIESPTNPNPDDPNLPSPMIEQIEVLEVFPSSGAVIQDDTIFVAFSDELDELPTDVLYVVQAPYKASLSILDLLTTYSPAKAVPGTVSLVDGTTEVLQWKAESPLPVEKEYVVIVSKDIKGIDTDKLGVPLVHAFRTPWERLYGDINSIKEKLGDLAASFRDSTLYEAMHVNTLFAYDTVSNTNSFERTQFQDGQAPYYIHQYVNLQTAYDVLLNGMANSNGASKENITLGQLQVIKEIDVASAVILLKTLKTAIKPWLDMVHGMNNRGYAKPGVVVKGETISPYPDFLTRSELKTNFDV